MIKTEVWNINFQAENQHLISHVAAVYKYPERNVQFGWRGDFSVHNSAICMKSENSREFGQDYNITGQFVPHYTSPTVTLDLAWNPLYFIILAPKVTCNRKWIVTRHSWWFPPRNISNQEQIVLERSEIGNYTKWTWNVYCDEIYQGKNLLHLKNANYLLGFPFPIIIKIVPL